jgi:NitT/TauT family transport system ATP-binding protein
MSSNPGRIRGQIKIDLCRPRERNSSDFRAMADHIYTIMTNPDTSVSPITVPGRRAIETVPLPHARPGAISGLLEIVEDYGGVDDVAVISDRLRIEADDLLPILDAAVLLGFAEVREGDVILTETGRAFAEGEVEESKRIFRTQVLDRAPLVRTMYEALLASRGGQVGQDFFLDILDENYSEEEARSQFDTAVHWARYAGLFEYDADEETLRLHEIEQ